METDYYHGTNDRLMSMQKEFSPYVYNMETMGFCLDTKKEISMFKGDAEPVCCKIDNCYEYSRGLIETLMEAQSEDSISMTMTGRGQFSSIHSE